MADDLERRLERALADLPGSGPEAESRARRAALSALPAVSSRPPRRRATGLLAAAAVLVVASGVALAATGRIAVRVGEERPAADRGPAPAPSGTPLGQPALPAGEGVAAVVDGRLWLTTSRGLTIAGLAASSATLSPSALYAAVGVGPSLVAMAPDGRRPWTQRTPGPVVAISWAPYPILVAYVARAPGGFDLRMIEGNGEGDRLLARGVAPVAPAWRPDTKAVAFVSAGGSPMIWDANTLAARPVAMPRACAGALAPARTLAFSPAGGAGARLAVLTRRGQVVATGSNPSGPTACRALPRASDVTGLAWVSATDLVTAERPADAGLLRRLGVGGSTIRQVGASRRTGVGFLALVAAPGGRLAVMASADPRASRPAARGLAPGRMEVWLVPAPLAGRSTRLTGEVPLLALAGEPARAAWARPGAVSLALR